MTHALEFHSEWLEHNGALVTVDGLRCKLRVATYQARYPVVQDVITVHAEPTVLAKRSKAYLQVRRELRDDWSTDVLESDISVQVDILKQLARRRKVA